MFGLGMGELLVLAFIILLLFGAKKLPALGESFGKSIKSFKKGLDQGSSEIEDKTADKDNDSKPQA
ncbi:MAG: Sec-independent protein translocase subunit TatA/TatB [Bacteriovoracaceae bacterium]